MIKQNTYEITEHTIVGLACACACVCVHEPHPVREKSLALRFDQNLARVERDARLHAAHAVLLSVRLTDIKQRFDLDRGICAEVQRVHRRIICIRHELVEVLVLLCRHLLRHRRPQRLDCVHLTRGVTLANEDRKVYEV